MNILSISSFLKHIAGSLAVVALASCGSSTGRSQSGADTIPMQPCPVFCADSAMSDIEVQCSYGPRVLGTDEAKYCGDWIVQKFRNLGLEVEEQTTTVAVYNGTQLPARNIIARLNPDNIDRILLCAHWDSRPWADNDLDENNHRTPILGANDGASGVAVLLELARVIQQDKTIKTGIDFVCFDAEDYGFPQWAQDDIEDTESTWCLGSRYWAEQAAANGDSARFGILLDMVGGLGSSFAMEGFSKQYAEPVAQMLWHIGRQIGYSSYFPLNDGGYITDDHLPVNRIARVPCIDVIPHFASGPSSFGPTWHTVNDTPANIDPAVLEAVGQTVLQMLYNDNAE
ncbi:MAG: M28 family peptidase [Bacteroidaceae bacterium]|nr:M28 family peptidase [Bacteroidaceae bacterium]